MQTIDQSNYRNSLKIISLITVIILLIPVLTPAHGLALPYAFGGERTGISGDVVQSESHTLQEVIQGCIDLAHQYVNCDELRLMGNTMDQDTTILVIDDGLSPIQWMHLEYVLHIDIIKYIGFNWETEQVFERGSTGRDDLLDMFDIIKEGQVTYHGSEVVSTIAQYAPGVKIIFVSMGTEGLGEPLGNRFDIADPSSINEMWGAIKAEVADEVGQDVKIINYSWTFSDEKVFTGSTAYNSLIDDYPNLIMIGGAGNEGQDFSESPVPTDLRVYPQVYPEWWAIGSVDHETYNHKSLGDDDDSYDEDWVNEEVDGSDAVIGRRSIFSNYGSTSPGANSIDYVMPGNGVPVYSDYKRSSNRWFYTSGTSYSAPGIAAAAAIAIDAFKDGIDYFSQKDGLTNSNPIDRTLVSDIFSKALVNPIEEWNEYTGYGYLDFKKSYTEGFNHAAGEVYNIEPDMVSIDGLHRLNVDITWSQKVDIKIQIYVYRVNAIDSIPASESEYVAFWEHDFEGSSNTFSINHYYYPDPEGGLYRLFYRFRSLVNYNVIYHDEFFPETVILATPTINWATLNRAGTGQYLDLHINWDQYAVTTIVIDLYKSTDEIMDANNDLSMFSDSRTYGVGENPVQESLNYVKTFEPTSTGYYNVYLKIIVDEQIVHEFWVNSTPYYYDMPSGSGNIPRV